MDTQKIRCAKCGAVVAELDGDQLTFDHFHRRRRRVGPDDLVTQPVTWGLDDPDTTGVAKANGDFAPCRGRCGQTYSLAQLLVVARKLRRTGRASAKVST